MSTVERVIRIALGEVGYHEGRDPNGNWNNHQKYSPAVPGLEWSQDQAWCATFMSWTAVEAGCADLFPRTASTDTAAAWYKQRGQWSEFPAVGAQGFLGTGNDMHHTFLVVAFDADWDYTVEGNSNQDGSAQGDGVYKLKRYRRSSEVAGYGYPAYPEGIKNADPTRQHLNPKAAPAPVKPNSGAHAAPKTTITVKAGDTLSGIAAKRGVKLTALLSAAAAAGIAITHLAVGTVFTCTGPTCTAAPPAKPAASPTAKPSAAPTAEPTAVPAKPAATATVVLDGRKYTITLTPTRSH